jgi:hypothetical protein
VRACAALYLLLPGRRRAGAPEAPATGSAAFNMSIVVPASLYSGCAAVRACIRLSCLRAGMGGFWVFTVYSMLVQYLFTCYSPADMQQNMAAHSECQEVWGGPSWSSYQQCIEGAQLTSCIMLSFASICTVTCRMWHMHLHDVITVCIMQHTAAVSRQSSALCFNFIDD